jgi:hypothetical protein
VTSQLIIDQSMISMSDMHRILGGEIKQILRFVHRLQYILIYLISTNIC